MSDEDEDDEPTMRDVFQSLLGHDEPAAANATTTLGSVNADTVFLDFDVHDTIQIDHDGTRYEVVETEDGLGVEVADE